MKLVFLSLLFAFNAFAIKPMPVKKKAEPKVVQTKPVHPVLKKEEDCDDKAKKPIEIKPETISLGGGNTGCTLPE